MEVFVKNKKLLDNKILEIARKGLHLGKIDIKKIREEMYGRNRGIL